MASRALLGVATCLVVSEGALPPASDGDFLGPDRAADAGASPGAFLAGPGVPGLAAARHAQGLAVMRSSTPEAFDRDHSNPTAAGARASPGALDRDRVSPAKSLGTWSPATGWGIPGSVRDDLIRANQALAENDRMKDFTAKYSVERGKLLRRSKAYLGRAVALNEENTRLNGEVASLKEELRATKRNLGAQMKGNELLNAKLQQLTAKLLELQQRPRAKPVRGPEQIAAKLQTLEEQILENNQTTVKFLKERQVLHGEIEKDQARIRELEDDNRDLASNMTKDAEAIHFLSLRNNELFQRNEKLRESNEMMQRVTLNLMNNGQASGGAPSNGQASGGAPSTGTAK